jgi:hypothetical protein
LVDRQVHARAQARAQGLKFDELPWGPQATRVGIETV